MSTEDQDRDFVAHIRERFRLRQESAMVRAKKALSDRDILARGLDCFWGDFRKAMGELCERLSRELRVSLSCKWNGEELNVTKSGSRYVLNAKAGTAPPYEVVISGRDGLQYSATVHIVLEDSQLGCLPEMDGEFMPARKAAMKALEEFLVQSLG